jgi:hypothetical protein
VFGDNKVTKLSKDIFQFTRLWLSTGLLLSVSLTAQAAPLNLQLLTPDIYATAFDTAYDANTGTFTASTYTSYGYTSTYGFIDGGNEFYLDFSLNANISGGGSGYAVLNSGSFSITELICGDYGLNCTAGSLLIAGDLIDFGYANDSQQTLEFLFDPTGGSLKTDYDAASTAGNGGIILHNTGYNENNFNTSFNSEVASSFADIAPVPVPASVWLFGSGLLGLVAIGRRTT